MNKHDYLKARIESGRGIKVDRETVYRGSFAGGCSAKTYRGGEYMTDAEGKRIKGGKVANNTFAYHETARTIVVRFHTTDILQCWDDGLVVALSGHDSFTTRVRHKEHMASGWSTSSFKDRVFLWGPCTSGRVGSWFDRAAEECGIYQGRIPFLLPFGAGCVTGWDASGLAELMVGVRVGCPLASDALARFFREKAATDAAREDAWTSMAEIVEEWRGRRFGYDVTKYRKLYATLDEPTSDGLWLCDPSTGVLERALTRKDAVLGQIEEGKLTIGGRVWDLVDGFSYSAKGVA